MQQQRTILSTISLNNSKTRSQLYFEDLFQIKDVDWKHVYLLPRRVTVDTNLRIFQYKTLTNVLYLNENSLDLKRFYVRCVLFASLKMTHQCAFSWLH